MGRPVIVRAATATGQSVIANQKVYRANATDTLDDIYASLDVSDRLATGCVVFSSAMAAAGDCTQLDHLDTRRGIVYFLLIIRQCMIDIAIDAVRS